MRYRHLRYRYTMVYAAAPLGSGGDGPWPLGRARVVVAPPHWHPDTDVCETPGTIEVAVDVAGVAEDEVEIKLFDDALVIDGVRRLPACGDDAVYHAVAIRQGPFHVAVPLHVAVDPEGVRARFERGLLLVTLAKAVRREGRG